jgi:hypothetical protein
MFSNLNKSFNILNKKIITFDDLTTDYIGRSIHSVFFCKNNKKYNASLNNANINKIILYKGVKISDSYIWSVIITTSSNDSMLYLIDDGYVIFE